MVGNRQDAAHHRIEAAKCHQAAIGAKDSASRLYWEQAERCWLMLANQAEVALNLLSGRNGTHGRNGPARLRTDSGTSLWGRRLLQRVPFTHHRCGISLNTRQLVPDPLSQLVEVCLRQRHRYAWARRPCPEITHPIADETSVGLAHEALLVLRRQNIAIAAMWMLFGVAVYTTQISAIGQFEPKKVEGLRRR